MKRSILCLSAVLAAVGALPAASYAEGSEDALSVVPNVGVVSDYRYRGISQSRLKPALQGGLDISKGPFYIGTWASTIKWIKDAGGDASVEIDLYGGYKGDVTKDVKYDVGVLTYQYPSNKLHPSANTTEIYGALTFGPVTAKYSHSLTNTFGVADSKNSGYLDLSATIEVESVGINITPHVGYQKFTGASSGPATYTDYSLTVSKDIAVTKDKDTVLSTLTLSAAVIGTDADKSFYASPRNGKFMGKSTLVLGAKYAF